MNRGNANMFWKAKFRTLCLGVLISLTAACELDISTEDVKDTPIPENPEPENPQPENPSTKLVDTETVIQLGQPFETSYMVSGQATKSILFDLSIAAAYAHISIEVDGKILLDSLNIPSSGQHSLTAIVEFDGTGEKAIKIIANAADITVKHIDVVDATAKALPKFTDISADIGLFDDPSLKYGGPSIADMDNDGDYDLILNNHNDSPSKLYWNNGDGSLTKNSTDLSLWKLMDLHGSAAGDYDNDGDLDLIITLGGGNGTNPTPPVFFRNDNGTLVRSDTAVGITAGARGRSPRWLDLDMDGDLDLALFNAAGINGETGAQHIFYCNKGDGTFEVVDILGLGYASSDRVLVTDFNKDGIDDILMIAPMSLWQGNGDFTFSNVSDTWLPQSVRDLWGGIAATDVDLDNDGDLDIYVAAGKGYYSVADKSLDFNPTSQQMDISDKGDTAGKTEFSFSADSDIKLINYDTSIIRTSGYTGDFEIFLGADKTAFVPADRDEVNPISQTQAQGWPTTRDANGIYIGHLGNGEWKMEIVRDQKLSWSIKYSLAGISSVQTDWQPNNRNMQDTLLINQGDKFELAPASWNIPQGGNHWGVTHGDFNNDSFNDIFVYRYTYLQQRVADYILLNTGQNSFEIVTSDQATAMDSTGHADSGQAFDFDLDGDVDVLSGDDEYGLWHMFQNDYAGTNQFTLVQVGYSPIENIDPISAQVTVTTAFGTYYKRVGSSGESHSQSLLNTIHFGLADASGIESIEIRWRNGETVYLKDQAVNTLLKSADGEFPEPNSIKLTPEAAEVRVGRSIDLSLVLEPVNANPNVNWISDKQNLATVDNNGVVTGVAEGTGVTITATSTANAQSGSAVINVVPYFDIPVSGISLLPESTLVLVGSSQKLTASFTPDNADIKDINWTSTDDSIATVDEQGVVRGIADGQVIITATTLDGGFEDSSTINVETYAPPSIAFSDEDYYKTTEFLTSASLDVVVDYHAGTGDSVIAGVDDGAKFFLREMTSDWSNVVKDYTASDARIIGTTSGQASVSIPLTNVTPTAELADGNFYFLWVRFSNSEGEVVDKGVWPVNIVAGDTTAEPTASVCNASNLVSCGNNDGEGADVTDWYAFKHESYATDLSNQLSVSSVQAKDGNNSIMFAFNQAGIQHFVYDKIVFEVTDTADYQLSLDVYGDNLSVGTDYVIEISFRPVDAPENSETYKLWQRKTAGSWHTLSHAATLPQGQYFVGFKAFSPGVANTLTLDYYLDNITVSKL